MHGHLNMKYLSTCLYMTVVGSKESTRKVARRLNPVRANGSRGITSGSPSIYGAFVICQSSSLFYSILKTDAANSSEIIVSNNKITWCQSENTIT
jgi:hypothetical protein